MKKSIWKNIAVPVTCLIFFLSFYVVWEILDLPPIEDMKSIAVEYFDKYGFWVVFVSAIIEGMLLVGWYYPGSLIILLGVIFAEGDIFKFIYIVALVTIGLFIAYIINYIIGKFGWYKLLIALGLKKSLENSQKRLIKYGLKAIFLSYWQPNFAAVTSTAAGILQLPFKKFLLYSFPTIVIWNILWGTIGFILGETAIQLIGLKFVLFLIVSWIGYETIMYFVKKQKKATAQEVVVNNKSS